MGLEVKVEERHGDNWARSITLVSIICTPSAKVHDCKYVIRLQTGVAVSLSLKDTRLMIDS